MGELVIFTPRAPAKDMAVRPGLPATIVIFPGVRYERESRAAGQEKSSTAESAKG